MTENRITAVLWALAVLLAGWLFIFDGGDTRTEFMTAFWDGYHDVPEQVDGDPNRSVASP